MTLLNDLSRLVGEAFAAEGLVAGRGEVVVSQRPELAQFQCNGALAAAKESQRNPRELGEAIAARLTSMEQFAKVEVAGPGFINLTLTDKAIARYAQQAAHDPRLGVSAPTPETVVVDYAGPNVAKAMHVGHLRATIIGDSLQRIFRFLGHKVIRDPHFGDWGFQMGLLIAALAEEEPSLPYFDPEIDGPYPETSPLTLEDLQTIYPQASERAERDEAFAACARQATVDLQQGRPGYLALWRQMKRVSEESQRRDFADLGVEFDLWYGESDVADRLGPLVEKLREAGLAIESRGALIVPVDLPDDKRDLPPLILETSVGGYLYSATDLATLEMRAVDLDADLILYVVDARQADHFEQVFRAARRAGLIPPATRLEHIRFGTMNGKDGRPFRTRAGGVVSLRDLINLVKEAARTRLNEAKIAEDYPEEERECVAHQVGLAALKFGDLINNRQSDYVFDLERFSSLEGKTGPYLQYGAVRIRSIQRRAAERNLRPGPLLPPEVEAERTLMLELLRAPEIVERGAELRAPNHIAEYAYQVAASWNRFYDTCHILDESDPHRQASWLGLAGWTLSTLITMLGLLGIEVPERM